MSMSVKTYHHIYNGADRQSVNNLGIKLVIIKLYHSLNFQTRIRFPLSVMFSEVCQFG